MTASSRRRRARRPFRTRAGSSALIVLPGLAHRTPPRRTPPPSRRSPRRSGRLHRPSRGPGGHRRPHHDVEALPHDPSTVYVATASGGLWKSVNRGITWANLWEHMPVSTFGDLAIAPSNPEHPVCGHRRAAEPQSTSWGNGVYRSDDAGATWRHWAGGDPPHGPRAGPSERSQHSVRGRAWQPLATEQRPGRLPLPGRRRTAGRRSSTWTSTPARSTWSSTPPTRTCSTRRCTSGSAAPGASTAAGRGAASTRRPTGATAGASSPAGCPRATRDGSESRSRPPIRRCSTRSCSTRRVRRLPHH